MGRDLTEIATALIGVALIALLIGNAGGTKTVIDSATSGFNGLLRTVTLQNGYSNAWGS